MGLNLKKLFKKKEGGTVVGNLFRAGTAIASKVFTGGAADGILAIVNPVPGAPVNVQKVAQQALEFTAQLPAVSGSQALTFATQAAQQVISAGGTSEEAEKVAATVQSVAQEPPVKPAPPAPKVSVSLNDLEATLAAQKALGTTLEETPAAVQTLAKKNGITKEQVLTILKDGALAAKDAMVQSWLDKTESGKQTKTEAIIGQLQQYALPILVVVGGLWYFKKK